MKSRPNNNPRSLPRINCRKPETAINSNFLDIAQTKTTDRFYQLHKPLDIGTIISCVYNNNNNKEEYFFKKNTVLRIHTIAKKCYEKSAG